MLSTYLWVRSFACLHLGTATSERLRICELGEFNINVVRKDIGEEAGESCLDRKFLDFDIDTESRNSVRKINVFKFRGVRVSEMRRKREAEEIASWNWSGIEVICAEKSSSHDLITVRFWERDCVIRSPRFLKCHGFVVAKMKWRPWRGCIYWAASR